MMMNPASSSGGEDDSSSSYPSSKNSPGANIVREAAGRPRRGGGRDLEPADSDDGSSVDDDDDDDDDGEGEEELGVTNFEDLPTDDSEDEDGDGDSSDGDGEGSGDEDGCDDDVEENLDREDDDDDDVPLAERVASRAGAGRRPAGRDGGDDDDRRGGAGGRGGRAERKERAIELASRRLRESRNSRRVDGASDASDPSKAGKRGDRTNSNNRPSSHDDDDDDDDDEHDDCDRDRGGPKRKKSKHAPTEVSSRRRDYFARGRPDLNSSGIGVTIGANRYRARDPRTVSLSGHLDADAFAGRYGFLDEMQEGEIETLKRRVSAWKTSGKKGQKERKRLGIVATGGGGGIDARGRYGGADATAAGTGRAQAGRRRTGRETHGQGETKEGRRDWQARCVLSEAQRAEEDGGGGEVRGDKEARRGRGSGQGHRETQEEKRRKGSEEHAVAHDSLKSCALITYGGMNGVEILEGSIIIVGVVGCVKFLRFALYDSVYD